MHFDPSAGGWINVSQLTSTGEHSPGTKADGNGNLRYPRSVSPTMGEPEAVKSYGIKLGPTEMMMIKQQEKDPFSQPTCTQRRKDESVAPAFLCFPPPAARL